MRLEEAIEFDPLQAEHFAEFHLGDTPLPKLFEGEAFAGPADKVGPGRSEAVGDFVRNLNRNLNTATVPWGDGRTENRDRGKPRGSTPPTPPDMRVRIRRFGGLSYYPPVKLGIPSELK